MGTVLLSGPLPPSGDMLCAVCAGMYKHAAIASRRDEITAHERAGEGTLKMHLHPPPGGSLPAAAVAWGIVPALGAAFPLCWTHMPAIDTRGGGLVMPARGPLDGGIPLDGSR